MTASERARAATYSDAPPSARVFLSALHSLSAHVAWWHSDADISQPPVAEREEGANKWAVVLALAASAAFMTSLDSSIVNIALPSIAHGFRAPLSGSIEWVLDGYLVVIAATLLTFGRLADVLGRKRVLPLAVSSGGRTLLPGPGRRRHLLGEHRDGHEGVPGRGTAGAHWASTWSSSRSASPWAPLSAAS